ncbi:MAG: cytochrome o ubiquinol oxidase subunit IV [Alphaproteobacteria bacterium]|nr:cytochrome o ubiquinol oxidase subunit IV [Alphaproteobacteria bacterium]
MSAETVAVEPDPHVKDRAPGDEPETVGSISKGVRSYLLGLGLAVLLTAASFWTVLGHGIYRPGVPVAVLVLAIAQMGIHLIFFLHITTAPDNTNNVLALAFGTLIVSLVVFGTLWIMATMNHNMMPPSHLLQMHPP